MGFASRGLGGTLNQHQDGIHVIKENPSSTLFRDVVDEQAETGYRLAEVP